MPSATGSWFDSIHPYPSGTAVARQYTCSNHVLPSDIIDWSIDADNPMSYGPTNTGSGSLGSGIGDSPDGSRVTLCFAVDVPHTYLATIE